ncbi:MAG: leucyl/phenylalanyl-tRNA--protein transferase, partial [Burkholderiales bacterium]
DLVGGLYGVALGRMFFGESMFSRATDASKVALVALVQELRARGFPLIDCQMHTPLLASLGGREIPRRAFLRALSPLVNYAEPPGQWDRVAT